MENLSFFMATFNYYFSLLLAFLSQITGNLGLGITLFTIVLRMILFPLTLSSLKAARKMRLLQPELTKLQKLHKGDASGLQKAQLKLYQDNKINPLAGCLPQILQLVLLIVLYQGLIHFFSLEQVGGYIINPSFLWMNLGKPDQFYILPILAGVSQFGLSLLMMGPISKQTAVIKNEKNKKVEKNKKDESEGPDMASMMQKQMLYVMPIFSAFIALKLPSGLVLYWVVSTVVSAIQQLYANRAADKDASTLIKR